MNEGPSTLLVVLVVVAASVAALVLLSLFQKGVLAALKGPLSARVRVRYPDEAQVLAADYGANSFGLESKGKLQLRGNGALVLTPKELRFFQYMPESEVEIPLTKITEISFVRSHLGKATPYRLLKVQFAGQAGPDSIAVFVRDPDAMRTQLEQARSAASKSSTES